MFEFDLPFPFPFPFSSFFVLLQTTFPLPPFFFLLFFFLFSSSHSLPSVDLTLPFVRLVLIGFPYLLFLDLVTPLRLALALCDSLDHDRSLERWDLEPWNLGTLNRWIVGSLDRSVRPCSGMTLFLCIYLYSLTRQKWVCGVTARRRRRFGVLGQVLVCKRNGARAERARWHRSEDGRWPMGVVRSRNLAGIHSFIHLTIHYRTSSI